MFREHDYRPPLLYFMSRDTVITCFVNTATCLLAGTVTFSILGHMAHNQVLPSNLYVVLAASPLASSGFVAIGCLALKWYSHYEELFEIDCKIIREFRV